VHSVYFVVELTSQARVIGYFVKLNDGISAATDVDRNRSREIEKR